MMRNRATRKTQQSIITDIMKVLNDGRTHNADEIAKLSGVSWSTAINWLDNIVLIQNYPRVFRDRVGRTNLFGIAIEQARRR